MALVTRFKQSSLLAGLALGVMTHLPACVSAPEASGAERPGSDQEITTQGHGEVRVSPDSFRVSVGVEAEASTVEEAQREVNEKMQQIIQALRRLGIPDLVLQTRTLQIFPIRETPEAGRTRRITGYRAANSVDATVRAAPQEDLGAHASRIVDAAVRAGANDVGGISFFVNDVREAQEKALQAAVKDAERNARAMADAAGVALGGIASLEGSVDLGGGPFFRAAALDAGPAPTPIEIGESVIRGSVTARFAFGRR